MSDFASPVVEPGNDPDDAMLLRVDSFDADPLSLAASVDGFNAHRASKAPALDPRPPERPDLRPSPPPGLVVAERKGGGEPPRPEQVAAFDLRPAEPSARIARREGEDATPTSAPLRVGRGKRNQTRLRQEEGQGSPQTPWRPPMSATASSIPGFDSGSALPRALTRPSPILPCRDPQSPSAATRTARLQPIARLRAAG
jgi:hypothetical protein